MVCGFFRYKNGTEIKPDKRVVVHATPDGQCNLTVHQSTEEDAGTYVCVISNAAGESRTEANVSVEGASTLQTGHADIRAIIALAFRAPEFTDKFNDVTVPEASTCVLETTVSGLPFPDVKW